MPPRQPLITDFASIHLHLCPLNVNNRLWETTRLQGMDFHSFQWHTL